jgi:autotransporter-associated beta strand protein
VAGGIGGSGGKGLPPFKDGNTGANGAGIVGADLTIINESGGTISGGGSGASQGNAITFLNGTNFLTLRGASDAQLFGKIEIDAGSVTFNQSIDQKLSNAIVGAGALIQDGAGTLTLAGANDYTGATHVEIGTLMAGSDTGFSSASAFTVSNGATLDVNGHNVAIGSLADGTGASTVTNGGTVASSLTTGGDNTDTTFFGTIQDGTHALALVKEGTGTFTLAGANTYSGDTTVNGGAISISADDNLGSVITPGTLHLAAGTALDLTGTFTLTHAIVVTGDPTFDVAFGKTCTVNAQITGAGDVEKTGGGTLILSNGNNNYTLGTVIHAGTLDIATAGAAGASTHDITFGTNETGTLRIENAALSSNNFANQIDNFSQGDAIDLPGLSFIPGNTTYKLTGQSLIVSNGIITDTLTLNSPVKRPSPSVPTAAGVPRSSRSTTSPLPTTPAPLTTAPPAASARSVGRWRRSTRISRPIRSSRSTPT